MAATALVPSPCCRAPRSRSRRACARRRAAWAPGVPSSACCRLCRRGPAHRCGGAGRAPATCLRLSSLDSAAVIAVSTATSSPRMRCTMSWKWRLVSWTSFRRAARDSSQRQRPLARGSSGTTMRSCSQRGRQGSGQVSGCGAAPASGRAPEGCLGGRSGRALPDRAARAARLWRRSTGLDGSERPSATEWCCGAAIKACQE